MDFIIVIPEILTYYNATASSEDEAIKQAFESQKCDKIALPEIFLVRQAGQPVVESHIYKTRKWLGRNGLLKQKEWNAFKEREEKAALIGLKIETLRLTIKLAATTIRAKIQIELLRQKYGKQDD